MIDDGRDEERVGVGDGKRDGEGTAEVDEELGV